MFTEIQRRILTFVIGVSRIPNRCYAACTERVGVLCLGYPECEQACISSDNIVRGVDLIEQFHLPD